MGAINGLLQKEHILVVVVAVVVVITTLQRQYLQGKLPVIIHIEANHKCDLDLKSQVGTCCS